MNAVIRILRVPWGEDVGHKHMERASLPERRTETPQRPRRAVLASTVALVVGCTPLVVFPQPGKAESRDAEDANDAKDGTVGTVGTVGMSVYSSEKLGFGFSYPSSFVVAFDRTESYAPRSIPTGEDVALASVGSYSKSFVTVTVFGKRVRDDTDPSRLSSGKDFFYERVIRPVVDSPTTIGFSLTNESAAGDGDDGHYDFEFEHSVCRGETIEGKAGALRCIGNFGQDLPVQSRCV